jgi:hypothetical protein
VEAPPWIAERDAFRREISNWKFQISNEVKAEAKILNLPP